MLDSHDRYVLNLTITHESPPPTDGHDVAGWDDVVTLTVHLDREPMRGETGARIRTVLEHLAHVAESALDARDDALLRAGEEETTDA